MTPAPRRTRRHLLLTVMLALAGTLFVLPGRAFAHAELLTADPAAGAVLKSPPTSITLTFTEPVEISLGAVRLFDGAGRVVEVGAAQHLGGRGTSVTVQLGVLADGSYVVDWRVVSADSHPVQGAYSFQVGPTADLQPGILADIIGRDHTSRPAGIGLALARALVIASIAMVFGGLVAIGWGIVGANRRVKVAVAVGAAVGAIAGLAQLPLEVGYATGRSLGVFFDASAWGDAFGTRIGTAWAFRAIVVAASGAALLATFAHHRRWWWRVALVLGLLATGAASAYGGHGATGRWIVVGVLATTLHVSAMAVWLGGVAALLLGFAAVGARGLRRFSALAVTMVAAVAASGVLQAMRQLGSFDALRKTPYGTVLIWKIVLVAGLVLIAAVSRRVVHREEIDQPRLGRVLVIEGLLAIAIVVSTSLLMAANPTAEANGQPFSATLIEGDHLASITLDPGRSGTNQLHIYLSSTASSLIEPDDVTVEISDPSRDVAAIQVPVTRSGAGHFTTPQATFAYAATWTLTVTARYATFDEVRFTAQVPIR